MSDFRLTKRFAVVLATCAFVAGCSSPSSTKIDYKSDSRVKEASLTVPPNMMDKTADQRSLPPVSGETSLSSLQQMQQVAPQSDTAVVVPITPGMHLQRDGTESWLVIDDQVPAAVWPQIRRFWQEQGFLLVIDQRDKGVMETDWNEAHPSVNQGLIRGVITKATGNSYVMAERNKYRTRLDATPNGGTYVFISQKGVREALTGPNNDSSKWDARPNDPALETEYLKRLMAVLAQNDACAKAGGTTATAVAAPAYTKKSGGDAAAAQNVANSVAPVRSGRVVSGNVSDVLPELTLGEPYDRSWLRVGLALDHANFTVDDRDRTKGLYYVSYVDPKDLTAAEQGFWSQLFHGKKEKTAKQYLVNVKALTQNQTRIAIVDASGNVDSTGPASQIMGLLANQLR
ncbi:MAG: outer membrane protein assembly factor BamC [Burkholderia sp.]